MSMLGVLVLMNAGAAALAPWVDYRFPRLAPDNFGAGFLHFLLAKAAFAALIPAISVTAGMGGVGWKLAGLLGLVLPTFVYKWLAWFWVLKLAFSTLRGRFN